MFHYYLIGKMTLTSFRKLVITFVFSGLFVALSACSSDQSGNDSEQPGDTPDTPTTEQLSEGETSTPAATTEAKTEPTATPRSDDPRVTSAKPHVVIKTNLGEIVIELFEDRAPISTANFLQYANDGFYDGTIFHRVISNFMIQAGGFDENANKKPTRAPIRNEANNGLTNTRGTVAMARTADPHSATSQFFINVVDKPHLNFKSEAYSEWGYAVFGQVVSGLEVVDRIRKVPTSYKNGMSDFPARPVIITDVVILQQ